MPTRCRPKHPGAISPVSILIIGCLMWTISNAKLGGAPSRIAYGVTPPGFVTRTGPRALEPGCYDIIVSGPSRTRFRIGADGRLTASRDSSQRAGQR